MRLFAHCSACPASMAITVPDAKAADGRKIAQLFADNHVNGEPPGHKVTVSEYVTKGNARAVRA